MEFSGALVLAEEDPLPATLRVDGDFLAIDSESGRLGRWPLAQCTLSKDGDCFLLMIEDEPVGFAPLDPTRMTDWVDTRWPATLADSVRAFKQKALPEVAAEPETPPKVSRLSLPVGAGMGAALVVLAIFVSALVARDQPTPNLLTSIPPATTVPPMPTVFTTGVDQVTFAWNDAADQLGMDLFLLEAPGPNRLQMNLREGLILYATEDPASGSVHSLMISAAPTSGENEGAAVLAAWGTLIATVNPELRGDGRRALLRDLGVEPDRPVPNGIKSKASIGGALYTLRTGVLGDRALLIVTPST